MARTYCKRPFFPGDHVRVDEVLPDDMRHFDGTGGEAIIASDNGKRRDSDEWKYTLFLKEEATYVSWYPESVLTLISRGQGHLIGEWESKKAAYVTRMMDLDWIFSQGDELNRNWPPESVNAVRQCLTDTFVPGDRADGGPRYSDSVIRLSNEIYAQGCATPFVAAKDKKGWLEFAEKQRAREAAKKK